MSRGPRSSLHYSGRSAGLKSNYEPGAHFEHISRSIGGHLTSNNLFVNALAFSLTGTELISKEGNFDSVTTGILNCCSGTIERFSSNTINCFSGHVNSLVSVNLNTDNFISCTGATIDLSGEMMSLGIISGLTGTFSSIVTRNCNFPSTAKFNSLNCDYVKCGDVYVAKNFCSSFYTNFINGVTMLCPEISGTYIYSQSIFSKNITHSSGSSTISYVGSNNMYLDNTFVYSVITGSSLYFTSITGSDISCLNILTPSITGSSASLTKTSGKNFYGTSLFIPIMTGAKAYMTDSITTNGMIESGSFSTYNIFAKGEKSSSVTINDIEGEKMMIGENTLSIDSSWTTSSAKIGGDLPNTTYMFHTSDDMKSISSYSGQYNAVWYGKHYITSDGGITWYPAIGIVEEKTVDLNGGIAVSRDGSLWIATRTSKGHDGGIYKSMDGINFLQVLSVPLIGTFSGSTFECCDISSDNRVVLVCLDSSPSRYQIPFYISREGGNLSTWRAIIPSLERDHYWISDTAISSDGKFMVVLDRNGIFTSVDYGNTWSLYSCPLSGYNKQTAISKNGSHMYVSSSSTKTFLISRDFGKTWANIPPTKEGYSGIDCDETGRYVCLTIVGKGGFLFSNNYGESFTMIPSPSANSDDININQDCSKIMIYDGRTSKFFMKKLETLGNYTGSVTVNGLLVGENVNIPSLMTNEIIAEDISGMRIRNKSILGLIKLMSPNKNIIVRAISNWTTTSGGGESISWSPELSMFCSVSDKIMISSDGKNWTTITSSPQSKDVCWSPEKGLFVIAGRTGDFMYSSDGRSWSHVTTSCGVNSICYSAEFGLFCSIGLDCSLLSEDGINWISYPCSGGEDVCFSGELDLFCCSSGSCSVDGKKWSQEQQLSCRSICWAPDLNMFCAVENDKIFTSEDGKLWKMYSFEGDWNTVEWSPELNVLVSVSNSVIGYSFDGLKWFSKSIPEGNWNDMCWSKELGIFVSVGDDKVMISKYIKKF